MRSNFLVNAMLICCLVAAIASLRNFYHDTGFPTTHDASVEPRVERLAVLTDGIHPLGHGATSAGTDRAGSSENNSGN